MVASELSVPLHRDPQILEVVHLFEFMLAHLPIDAGVPRFLVKDHYLRSIGVDNQLPLVCESLECLNHVLQLRCCVRHDNEVVGKGQAVDLLPSDQNTS